MAARDWLFLLGSIALAEGVGIIGSLVTFPAIPSWYAGLAKPFLSPPSSVFGPVWTLLYLLMGIAAFLVFRSGPSHRRSTALRLYALQLLLNGLWSILFFGYRNPGGAFIDIILLWLAIAATITAFRRISREAAWLLAPYLAWVSFAAYLNLALWMLNP